MLDVERTYDPQEVLRIILDAWQGNIWTAMPGIVDAFDAVLGTCKVTVAIKGKLRKVDASGARTGDYEDVVIPQLVDCPVVWPRGGPFALTFPVAAGDEVLCVFASRCIDAWWESGDVSAQAELRMHSLSDGYAILGVGSKPRALADVSTDSVQLRTEDGAVFVEVSADGVRIKGDLIVEGGMTFDGDINATGNITADGDIAADGEVTAMASGPSVTLSQHLHTSASPGSPTSTPTPGT